MPDNEVVVTQPGQLPPPPKPPEYYPGYTREREELAARRYQAAARVEESTAKMARWAELEKLRITQPTSITSLFKFGIPAGYFEMLTPAVQQEHEAATRELKSVEWRQSVLISLPGLLADWRYNVTKPEDIINYLPHDLIDDIDSAWLTTTFNNMSGMMNVLPEDFAGSTDEVQAKLLETVLTEPPIEMAAVHNLTVAELIKSFQEAPPELPAGMTTEDARDIFGHFELPEEEKQQLDEFLNEKASAWAIESDRINLIRAGLIVPEAPDLTPTEFAKLLFTQPMMATIHWLNKYFDMLPRPLVSAAIIGTHRLFKTPEDTAAARLEDEFNYYRSMGESSWDAYAKAFNSWDVDWVPKMLMEMAFDPTMYIGFGMATHAAMKLGSGMSRIGLKSVGSRIGPFVASIENGYVAGADAVFRAGKAAVLSPVKGAFYLTGAGYQIPRTYTMMARNFARKSLVDFKAVIERTPEYAEVLGGKSGLKGLTVKDLSDAADNIITQAIEHPTEGNNLAVRTGAELLEFNYLDDAASRSLLKGISTAELDLPRVVRLNNEVLNMFSGQGPRVTAGKIISNLGEEATEKTVQMLAVKLAAFQGKIATAAKAAFKGATPKDVMISAFERLEGIRYSNLHSPITKYLNQAGRSSSWVSRVSDNVLYSAQLVNFERKCVMPFARWNLLFVGFGPNNFFENMMRGFVGGGELIYPKSYSGLSETNRLFKGLTNRPYELELFERGEQRFAQAVVDPKTGATGVFKNGKVPFVTKDIVFKGKVIGKKINVYGKDYMLGSNQAYNDMWESFNTRQVAWDYQTHYMKALAEGAPDEMRAIQEIISSHGHELRGIKTFSKRDMKDLERALRQDATIGPTDIRAHADIDVFEMERRQVSKELGKTFDQCTDVRGVTKQGIRDEVLDGSMFKDVDGRMAAYAQAERELSIISLADQIDTLKIEADAFIKNPPRNMQEFLGDMQNITGMADGAAERIHDYRKLTELRSHLLNPGKEVDDFHVGSNKLLAEFMETSEDTLDKMMTQLTKNARAVVVEGKPILNEAQLSHLADLDNISRLEIENTLATRHKISEIESIITKTPKKARDERFWLQQRAQKAEVWDNFDIQSRKLKDIRLGASRRFLDSVDKRVYVPDFVPEVVEELTPNHLAYLFGVTGDDLYRGLTRVHTHATIRPREDFILYARNQADAYAAKFSKNAADIGFTDDAIGEVYDQLWRNLGVDPIILTPDSPTMMQMESIRQEINRLHAVTRIDESDMLKWKNYVNGIADDLEKTPVFAEKVLPDYDIGLGERLATTKELAEMKTLGEPVADIVAKGKVKVDQEYLVRIRAELTRIAEDTPLPPSLPVELRYGAPGTKYTNMNDLIDAWFATSSNDALQAIGRTASQSPAYLAKVRGILREKYPSGYIRIYRGSGAAKAGALEREWTNITSSRRTAQTFEDTWMEEFQIHATRETVPPSVDNVLVHVDDVVSIGAVEESELIIKASVLKQRIATPLKAPTVTKPAWLAKKETAMAKSRELHELAFPTYDDANIIDEAMRAIFPFWTYEAFRWRWIPRTWMRTPGTMTGMARYMDYTDGGYIPIPGTDLQINPLRGSIWMGGLRSMYLRDFPEYYDAFPGAEAIDCIGRWGFFPGIHVMGLMVLFGATAEGKPEFGQLAPNWFASTVSAFRAMSPEHIGKVIDMVYPDRFRDFQTMLTLGSEGYDADEIWRKKAAGTKLTDEEEKLWLRAEGRANGLKAILMAQSGLFRIRPKEYETVMDEIRLAIEDATGVSVRVQQQINRNYPVTGKRFSDYYKLDVMQQELLYSTESYRRWQGVTTALYPSSWQMMEVKIKDYYEALDKAYTDARRIGVYEDGKIVRPSIEELNRQWVAREIGPDQWLAGRSDIQSGLAEAARVLGESPAYVDVPKTLEERVAWMAEKGQPAPTLGPDRELLYYYYELKPEYKWDWEADRMTYDFDTYYAYIDALLDSLAPEFRERLLQRIQVDWTPLEKLYWQTSREYLRPYRQIRNAVLNRYTDEQKYLIRRYEVARGAERDSIREVIGPEGDKLISHFTRELTDARRRFRMLDPELDAWCYFFGKTDKLMSAESQEIYDRIDKQYLVESMIK